MTVLPYENPWKDTDPWEAWNLAPHVPEPVEPPVSLCASGLPVDNRMPKVVAYAAAPSGSRCSAATAFTEERRRGKFGLSSPMRYNRPCPNPAIAEIEYDDGSTVLRCGEHMP